MDGDLYFPPSSLKTDPQCRWCHGRGCLSCESEAKEAIDVRRRQALDRLGVCDEEPVWYMVDLKAGEKVVRSVVRSDGDDIQMCHDSMTRPF
jgi:hypothetical protein